MSSQHARQRETLIFWRYISSSIDRLVTTLDEVTPEEMNQSPAPNGNSLYVLATHTMGTTAENLLEVLCGHRVHRRRDAEFAATGHSSEPLHQQWHSLRAELQARLEEVDDAALAEMREHPRRGSITGREVLIVVARHCAEHMGQAFLTRDLLLAQRESDTRPADTTR